MLGTAEWPPLMLDPSRSRDIPAGAPGCAKSAIAAYLQDQRQSAASWYCRHSSPVGVRFFSTEAAAGLRPRLRVSYVQRIDFLLP